MHSTLQSDEPPLIGDHLALNFLNTRYGTGSAKRECFVDDASVVRWLKQVGELPNDFGEVPPGLLSLTLVLRESARALVSAAKAREYGDTRVVNHVLERGSGLHELAWNSKRETFEVLSKRRDNGAAGLLYPIAQAIVDLLVSSSLDRVKQCQAPDCTLIFHDQTKSHRRRWCSMALCGNRMKVAAFRERKKLGE
ncbi:CGNR zinc finger domain-containing protein [Variovorax paradoxus]|jgi:predicted RNA-binding Zn ribbon-like protein|uniref:CGNR zinc finger domain-containing protein n=1 Tax=Variovorax paradoxus TaxID=34073 RepID=UPI0027D7990C|nr:CGNR zinc finger domain-containing protein [Variovorax paradoxus]